QLLHGRRLGPLPDPDQQQRPAALAGPLNPGRWGGRHGAMIEGNLMGGRAAGPRVGLGMAAVVLALSGCAKGPPPVTEVSGVVLLEGQPLPQAKVEFIPELSNFGAEMNSTAITDDQGRFTLTCAYKQQSGAVVGKHHVLVSERP